MKKLMGVTYQQLLNLTAVELNEIQAAQAMNQSREFMKSAGLPDHLIEKVCAVGLVDTVNLMNELLDEATYDGMRTIYDTEDRFNIAAEMMDKVGNVSARLQPMMSKIINLVLEDALKDQEE